MIRHCVDNDPGGNSKRLVVTDMGIGYNYAHFKTLLLHIPARECSTARTPARTPKRWCWIDNTKVMA